MLRDKTARRSLPAPFPVSESTFKTSSLMLFSLAMTFLMAAPAVAAAPDLGKDWKLTSQRHVRYFLADGATAKTTDRTLASTEIKDRTTERTTEVSHRERQDEGRILRDSSSERAGDKTSETRKEGRFVNSYDNWQVHTVKTTKTLRPYKLYDVYNWSERERTTFANAYRVKTRVEWQDPVTKEQLSTLTQGIEGPFDELSYGPWAAKSRQVLSGSGEDLLSSVERVVGSRDASKRTSTGFAAASNTPKSNAGNTFGVTSIYTSDAGNGEAGARITSGGATQRLTASNKSKAHGGGSSVLTDLFAVAEGRPDLYDVNGRRAWKLTAEGQALVFLPYDAKGNLIADPVRLEGNDLEGEAAGGTVHIKGFQVKGRNLTLSGNFRQAYLNKGKSHILVTL